MVGAPPLGLSVPVRLPSGRVVVVVTCRTRIEDGEDGCGVAARRRRRRSWVTRGMLGGNYCVWEI